MNKIRVKFTVNKWDGDTGPSISGPYDQLNIERAVGRRQISFNVFIPEDMDKRVIRVGGYTTQKGDRLYLNDGNWDRDLLGWPKRGDYMSDGKTLRGIMRIIDQDSIVLGPIELGNDETDDQSDPIIQRIVVRPGQQVLVIGGQN